MALEVPLKRSDNNCMLDKKAEAHANLVLEIRDRVADISKDEDFEMNLNLFLDSLAEDVMGARWD